MRNNKKLKKTPTFPTVYDVGATRQRRLEELGLQAPVDDPLAAASRDGGGEGPRRSRDHECSWTTTPRTFSPFRRAS